MSNEIALKDEIKNNLLSSINLNNYENQPEVFKRLNTTLDNVFNNRTISELYKDSLLEIPMSQSNFLSQCVQFTEHWTPHRKLKQSLIELKSKYGALNTAKNSHFKAINKRNQLTDQLQVIQSVIDKLEDTKLLTLSLAIKITSINQSIIPKQIFDILNNNEIDDIEVIDIIIAKLKHKAADMFVKIQEAEYSIKDTDHMVKDALDTASMYENVINKYKKEVEDSGLSYEEAEMEYYVMFLTWEIENQLRTGDHQIDRGTSKVITQLPNGLRRKVYQNYNLLRKKYFENKYPIDADFLVKTNPELFVPKKTGNMEFEGDNIQEFLGIEPIKQLSINE